MHNAGCPVLGVPRCLERAACACQSLRPMPFARGPVEYSGKPYLHLTAMFMFARYAEFDKMSMATLSLPIKKKTPFKMAVIHMQPCGRLPTKWVSIQQLKQLCKLLGINNWSFKGAYKKTFHATWPDTGKFKYHQNKMPSEALAQLKQVGRRLACCCLYACMPLTGCMFQAAWKLPTHLLCAALPIDEGTPQQRWRRVGQGHDGHGGHRVLAHKAVPARPAEGPACGCDHEHVARQFAAFQHGRGESVAVCKYAGDWRLACYCLLISLVSFCLLPPSFFLLAQGGGPARPGNGVVAAHGRRGGRGSRGERGAIHVPRQAARA